MLVAALTGGIASGKSTVVRMLQELGVHIIDLDLLSRTVVEPGKPAWREIVAHFGEGILKSDRTLNREALARIVFRDEEQRKVLEGFIHPRVSEEQNRLLEEIRSKDPHGIVAVDVPLLIELGLHRSAEAVILVHVPREMQRERLARRDGLSPEEVEARLEAQLPLDEKLPHADFVIDNSGDLSWTQRQVHDMCLKLRDRERERRPP